jgi:tetratricopeptide (TPR) repeat protein
VTLEPQFGQVDVSVTDEWQMSGFQALAWAYQETGRNDEALRMHGEAERGYSSELAKGRLNLSHDLFAYARNALLLGDHEATLDRLEQAVNAGWRQYLIHQYDRRWTPLHDHPRNMALVRRVTDDIERQRAEIERIDAESGFMERFEAARLLR